MSLIFNPNATKIVYEKNDTAQPYRIVDFSEEKKPAIVWFARTLDEANAFYNNPIPFRNKIEAQLTKSRSLKRVKI